MTDEEQSEQDRNLTAAAKIKAAIVAFINSDHNRKRSFREIVEAIMPIMASHNYPESNVRSLLSSLSDGKIIHLIKEGHHVFWQSIHAPKPPKTAPPPSPPKSLSLFGEQPPPPKGKDLPHANEPDISFELVRSTGKLRVTNQGITTEFAITEKLTSPLVIMHNGVSVSIAIVDK